MDSYIRQRSEHLLLALFGLTIGRVHKGGYLVPDIQEIPNDTETRRITPRQTVIRNLFTNEKDVHSHALQGHCQHLPPLRESEISV